MNRTEPLQGRAFDLQQHAAVLAHRGRLERAQRCAVELTLEHEALEEAWQGTTEAGRGGVLWVIWRPASGGEGGAVRVDWLEPPEGRAEEFPNIEAALEALSMTEDQELLVREHCFSRRKNRR